MFILDSDQKHQVSTVSSYKTRVPFQGRTPELWIFDDKLIYLQDFMINTFHSADSAVAQGVSFQQDIYIIQCVSILRHFSYICYSN